MNAIGAMLFGAIRNQSPSRSSTTPIVSASTDLKKETISL
jgi:hypothetical protein